MRGDRYLFLSHTHRNICIPIRTFSMPCDHILPHYYAILSPYSTHWGYNKEHHLHKLLVVNTQRLFLFYSKTVWIANRGMIFRQRLWLSKLNLCYYTTCTNSGVPYYPETVKETPEKDNIDQPCMVYVGVWWKEPQVQLPTVGGWALQRVG